MASDVEMSDGLLEFSTEPEPPRKPEQPRRNDSTTFSTIRDISLHLSSIAFTVVVLTLCFTNTYFEDVTRPNINAMLNAFQFVAALHGIIIAISLNYMAAYHLMHALQSSREGAVFGHVVTTFLIGSILPLASPSFWRSIFGLQITARRRTFGAFLFIGTWLAILVPPFSAVLLIPQLRWWQMDDPFAATSGFFYLNRSKDEPMWPSQINTDVIPHHCRVTDFEIRQDCPYAGSPQIWQWSTEFIKQFTDPNITQVAYGNMVRYLGAVNNAIDFGGTNHYGWSAATTSMGHTTRDLSNLYTFAVRHNWLNPLQLHVGRPKLTLSSADSAIPIQRPLVQVQCGMPVDMTGVATDMYDLTFPTDQLRFTSSYQPSSSVSKQVNISAINAGSPKVDFVDLADISDLPIMGMLVGFQFHGDPTQNHLGLSSNESQALFPCTLAAHFIPTAISNEPKTDNVAVVDTPDPLHIVNSTDLMSRARNTSLSLPYLKAINPSIGFSRGKVFEFILQSLSDKPGGNGRPYRYDASWDRVWPWLISSVTSMQLTDALARSQDDIKMLTFCEDCAHNQTVGRSIILNLGLQNGGATQEHTNLTLEEYKIERLTGMQHVPINVKTERYGYGWSIHGASKIIAATALMLHSVIVLVHLVIVASRREKKEDHGTVKKILVLANGSERIEGLDDEKRLRIEGGRLVPAR